MTYVIAVVALLLVVSPVMWMMPSPVQRRQARLRSRAAQLGLQVRLGELPQTRRQRVRREPARQGVSYGLPIYGKPELFDGEYRLCREQAGAAWEAEPERTLAPVLVAALDSAAAAVPADVVAIDLTPQGPVLWWSERGDEQVVASIAAQLQALAQAQLSAAA